MEDDLKNKILVEIDVNRWQSINFRQKIWLFLKNQISGTWSRSGNQFFFDDSVDAVIFKLYWS
jgi:hypothetical protein